MGSGTISARSDGQKINDTWFNILRTALSEDFLPRNSSGVVADVAGSLGSSSYGWLNAFLTTAKFKSNGNLVTLQAPAGLAAAYGLYLPAALPSTEQVMTLSAAGQMALLNLTGMIFPYGGSATPPTGFLLCDGTSYVRTDYSALFAVIGTAFGTADGTHFNVPDLRGRFIRGVAGGQATDPDRASRTAMAAGGNTADNVGSVQADAFESHTHDLSSTEEIGSGGDIIAQGTSPSTGTETSAATGGNETRPVNAYAYFMIKT